MTSELIQRIFWAAIMGGAIVFAIKRRDKNAYEENVKASQVYTSMAAPLLLPVYFLGVLTVSLFADPQTAFHLAVSACFGVFLQIFVFYIVLLAALPLLRRFVSPQSVAVLWLLPNYLYLLNNRLFMPSAPRWVVKLDGGWMLRIVWAWIAGFVVVFGWSIVQHLLFRHALLKNARPEEEPAILDIWQREQKQMDFPKAKLKLMRSETLKTPLSIGLLRSTIRVVLPDAAYSEPELELIFRHELAHILRSDSQTKLFLRFCTAVCWFNPLMWIAMKRCAEDLELACDEAVLRFADHSRRQQYAGLILRSAGDERGFTTCLSAGAKALRYRLSQVVHPGKRVLGALLAGTVLGVLLISGGYAAVAYEPTTAEQEIFSRQEPGVCKVENVLLSDGMSTRRYICRDEEALKAYMASLPLYQLSGDYRFSEESRELTVMWKGPEGIFVTTLREGNLFMLPLYASPSGQSWYVDGDVDFAYLNSLLEEAPEDSVTWFPGWLRLDFGEAYLSPEGERICVDPEILPEEGAKEPAQYSPAANGIFGEQPEQVVLYFDWEPISYSVTASDWDGGNVRELPVAGNTVQLEQTPTHYTVTADLQESDSDAVVTVRYRFDVDPREPNGIR